ncbi:MAG: hypothetical protein HY094_03930 [Candidatus Melainabacteria bacterium]|nr:hypothetical protein [Candidatus Melainabacteria bacterium]
MVDNKTPTRSMLHVIGEIVCILLGILASADCFLGLTMFKLLKLLVLIALLRYWTTTLNKQFDR